MTTEYDPFDAAMDAEAPSGVRTQFGEIQIDVWPCVLRKGEGKVPFDAGQHSTDERRTAIDMILIPTKGDYNIERKIIAESNEWAKIIKPSLRALNTDLRGINGKFVQVQFVSTGRKYTDKNSGEEREYTTFKFIAVYPGLDECLAAAEEFFNNRSQNNQNDAVSSQSAPATNGANPAERETALKFLPALWNASGKDVNEFAKKLAGNPLTSKYFTIDSDDVLKVIAA